MGNFILSLKTEGTVVFLRPDGYLDDLGAEKIVQAGDAAIRGGCRGLVLDCSAIRFINSVGVSVLVSLIKRAQDAGCPLSLSNVLPVHKDVFDITGISRLVPVRGAGDEPPGGRETPR